MSVGRVGMFNFLTEADCEKFIAMHTGKVPALLERGLLEITWVRASEESVLMFVIFETKEIADQLFDEMSEWRKLYDFKITDTVVFDGAVIDQLRKNKF
ncbi:hypothetical protein OA340_01315 [Paracoccaceae bacterium]|nr:hypothetical protein [Paracoccaceae bacterium]MDC3090523.1 hypothetical protein [Paracoccaceae bacterium]